MIKKILSSCLILVLVILSINSLTYSQKKLAQTGFQFLSVGTNARATAMGEAYTTVAGSSEALFYNPAGLASVTSFIEVSLNQMEWIADIKYISGNMSLNLSQGKYGVLGLSFLTVDYGQFYWTRVADNEQGFLDYDEMSDLDVGGLTVPKALMIGVGYAKQLSDNFSVGGQVKYVYQNLGKSIVPELGETETLLKIKEYSLGELAYDFGTQYRTGFKSFVFGMSVRNFSREVKYEKEGFQMPLTFRIGVSMDIFDFVSQLSKDHSLLISIDAVHPRSYPEFVNVGAEYVFLDMLALRAGYISNQDDYDLTVGFGVKKYGFEVDYSYMPFTFFNDVNRVSVKFAF